MSSNNGWKAMCSRSTSPMAPGTPRFTNISKKQPFPRRKLVVLLLLLLLSSFSLSLFVLYPPLTLSLRCLFLSPLGFLTLCLCWSCHELCPAFRDLHLHSQNKLCASPYIYTRSKQGANECARARARVCKKKEKEGRD